jgi:glycerol-3-phosphate cytidylyltransferase-like family protein
VKIVGAAEAARLAAAGATVVSGYFDPLIASHAERLCGLKREGMPLLVVIATPPNPILPAGARAELVASLRVVDHVTDADVTPQIRLEEEDAVRLQDLVEQVHARNRAAR